MRCAIKAPGLLKGGRSFGIVLVGIEGEGSMVLIDSYDRFNGPALRSISLSDREKKVD